MKGLHTSIKQEIIAKYRKHDKDTASPEVQIALLTARINHLVDHFKQNKHDYHSRRGLLKMVARRKKLLKYLFKNDIERFATIKKELKLR